MLYLSDYLENNRSSYYSAITKVRTDNDVKAWIVFFLKGVIETAERSVETFNQILAIDKEYKNTIQQMGSRSAKALKLIEAMYVSPSTNAQKVAEITGTTQQSAYALISEMEALGILAETTGGRRGKRYILKAYFDIFR